MRRILSRHRTIFTILSALFFILGQGRIYDDSYELDDGLFPMSEERRRRETPIISATGNLYLAAKFAPPKCERIQVEQCANIGYNTTRFPNFAGDTTASAAAESFATFAPLLGVKCAHELSFFLCSVYFPMCTDKVAVAIGPCRPLCETVRDGCITVMKEFGFPWPASLNCSKFPAVNSQDKMCMGGGPTSIVQSQTAQKVIDETVGSLPNTFSGNQHTAYNTVPLQSDALRSDENYVQHLKKYVLPGQRCLLSNMVYVNRSKQCVPLCTSTRGFSAWDLNVSRISTLLSSGICVILGAICTIGALLLQLKRRNSQNTSHRHALTGNNRASLLSEKSFCSNCGRKRFERTLLYSIICFMACALMQILSVYETSNLACTWLNMRSLFVVIDATPEHIPCTLVGAFLYFFGSAARLWWLLACREVSHCCILTKNEQNVTKLPHASIIQQRDRNKHTIFNAHLSVWCGPLALSTLALMLRAVHPEPLSAVCRVGGSTDRMHHAFVLARDLLLALCATVLLTWGAIKHITSPGAIRSPKSRSLSKRCYVGLCTYIFSLKGFICSLFPLMTIILVIIQLYERYSATVTPVTTSLKNAPLNFTSVYVNWNLSVVYKLYSDVIFGIMLGLVYFIYLARSFCKRSAGEIDCRGAHYGYRAVNTAAPLIPAGHIYDVYEYGRTSASSAYQPLQLDLSSNGNVAPPRNDNGGFMMIPSSVSTAPSFHYAPQLSRAPPNTATSGVLTVSATPDGASAGDVSLSSGVSALPPPPPPPPLAHTYSGSQQAVCFPSGIQNFANR